MSRLQDLINELCPDGVEYKKLSTVCSDIIVPMRDRPKTFDGTIPWCRIEDKQGQYFHGSLSGLGVSDKIVKQMNLKVFPVGTVICSCSASLGAYAINTIPLITNQTFIGLVCGDKLYNKYLLYYMETQTNFLKSQASTGTIPYISRKKFENMSIPIPPLPVQREIVRILDNFTELTAELQEELTARKKQYEYYRDNLLSFDKNIPVVQLRNIVDFKNGKGHEKDIIAEGKYIVVNSKFISTSGEVIKYSNKQICPLYVNDILMVMSDLPNGRALAKCFVVKEDDKYSLNQRIGAFHVKDETIITTNFLFYVLNRNHQLLRYDNGADQTNLRKDDILDIQIPIPPLEEQQRIVDILDRFDTLCNDLTGGLPAEIEARQKQYEYYRDKLLTFLPLEKGEVQ